MLKVLLNRNLLLVAGFKVQKFNVKDYQTMCTLIKQKFPIFNEAIELHKDIKLVDQNGKLVGRYSAAQARKKALTMKKDIVLVNAESTPAICKAYNFRENILKKFLDQIVNKRNQSLIRKASSSRQLKVATNLSDNELQIKTKQIIELAKKNLNVRVYAVCKQNQKQQGLAKFDHIKSIVQNKCIVQKDIKVSEYVEEQQDNYQTKKNADTSTKYVISMVFKSRDNQFMDLLTETSTKDPDSAIQIFLKRYYKQEDVDMRDLKSTAQGALDSINQVVQQMLVSKPIKKSKTTQTTEQKEDNYKKMKIQQKQYNDYLKAHSYVENQAKARLLNERLKRILQI